ncbi:MAG: S8 family serine peptidase [Flavobacteriales bacterium]|jgi:serine protease|nr:S8 family serine peptidase [Flavobacteriales bacterium]
MLLSLRTSLFLLCLLTLSTVAFPQAATVPGDMLAMLKPGTNAIEVAKELSILNGVPNAMRVEKEVSAPMRTWLFHFDPDAVPQAAMLRAFQAHPGVEMAQVNHRLAPRNVPDDPLYSQQWHHQNIDSEGAWDITTGGVTAVGDTIVVAIIEDADLTHPDLAANAWKNWLEIPGNGVDDDGNGYIDDVRGWDPAAGNDNVYSGSHGTEVAGMIGAVGNNGVQVSGANWHVKMMPVQYASTLESDVVAAYTYPLVMRRLYNQSGGSKGAFVVATNASWGVDGGQPANAPIWCALYDTLGTAGILNCGSTANNNVNIDIVGDLPTACPSEFMIAVTATNNLDMRTFSGYGATTIDVGAPGASVFTTTIGGGTGSASGTSFASPLTAGVVGLLYSVPCASLGAIAHNSPVEAAQRVRDALFAGVDQVGNLPGNTVTGGRINAFNSVQLLMDSCAACPAPFNLAATSAAIGSAMLTWNALPGTYTARYRQQGTTTWTEVGGLTSGLLPLSGLGNCEIYEFQVAADCDSAASDFGPIFSWTSEGCCTPPGNITAIANDSTSATISWGTVLASSTYDLRYREIGVTDWTELNGLSGNTETLSGLPACSDLEMQLRSACNGVLAPWSASTALHVPGCGQCVEGNFCTSEGVATYEWIAHVQVGSIDRISGSDGGYAGPDVTAQSTELVIGDTLPITLNMGYAGPTYREFYSVYLDLDLDGEFTTDEVVFTADSIQAAPVTGMLIVPASAPVGSTRLRVAMKYGSALPNGCTVYSFGETEDYCVNLVISPSGISETANAPSVRVFPQPASEQVHFQLATAAAAELVVLDATGRQIFAQRFTGGSFTLPVGGFAPGLYAYHINRPDAVSARGVFLVVH